MNFGTELQGISPTTVCQSLKLLIASICDLPDVINCQFREFAVAPLGPVHFLSPDQGCGIHCLIICGIQLFTLNNLGETWRHMVSHPLSSATHQNVWIPYCLTTTQLCPLCSTNMHLISQNSPTAAPNLIRGSLLLPLYSDPLFVVPKTLGNASAPL